MLSVVDICVAKYPFLSGIFRRSNRQFEIEFPRSSLKIRSDHESNRKKIKMIIAAFITGILNAQFYFNEDFANFMDSLEHFHTQKIVRNSVLLQTLKIAQNSVQLIGSETGLRSHWNIQRRRRRQRRPQCIPNFLICSNGFFISLHKITVETLSHCNASSNVSHTHSQHIISAPATEIGAPSRLNYRLKVVITDYWINRSFILRYNVNLFQFLLRDKCFCFFFFFSIHSCRHSLLQQ